MSNEAKLEISKIQLPNPAYVPGGTEEENLTYWIKDKDARDLISTLSGGLAYHIATNAADTPYGVTWSSGGTEITGTLVASAETTGFYLVPSGYAPLRDVYDEYVAVLITESPATYNWERLGNTEVDFSNLASKLSATPTLTKDKVFGENTTFTAAASAVSFSGGSSDTFVKSYPGTTSKLVRGDIRGVKTGANSTTTASKATAGTAVTLATQAANATSVSYIGNSSTSSILEKAQVNNEILSFVTVGVSQNSVTGTSDTVSITPYTFTDVTVPIRADADSSFATGTLDANGGGDAVLTGLGTATTASAVTNIGTGTAAGQIITPSTNDRVDAVTNVSVTITDA